MVGAILAAIGNIKKKLSRQTISIIPGFLAAAFSHHIRGGHGSVYISKVSHFTFVWLVSKNLGHG
jgi:hypothetical protein